MKINELNKRVIIQKQTECIDNKGFPVNGWYNFISCYAKVNNLFGKEFYNAMAVSAEKTVEFTVRYTKLLDQMDTKNYRIKFNNKDYNITFIDNILYKNQYVKLKAVEVM